MVARNNLIDLMRFTAIVLMVVFHFIYDLRYFGFVDWNTPDGPGWREFRFVILFLFLFCVGFGSAIKHQAPLNVRKWLWRLGAIALGAILVTANSLIMFPDNWIYFGILQFILFASIIATLLRHVPKLSLFFGLMIIAAYNLEWVSTKWPFYFFSEHLPSYSADYVSIFPWLGVVLLGVWCAHQSWMVKDPLKAIRLPTYALFASNHSLIIYMVHQPIMFGLIIAYMWLTSL